MMMTMMIATQINSTRKTQLNTSQ